MKKIRIIDTTCRDGMHAMGHQFDPGQMAKIAEGLNAANVDTMEVSHGDGLAGHSLQYGFAKHSDRELLQAVSAKLTKTKLAILLLPGIGTKEELNMAFEHNTKVARIATHVTEADISQQHIVLAKELGMEAIGVLMLAHMESPANILVQAKLMQSYGADGVYIMDSAGALLPEGVRERVETLVDGLDVAVGFHAHNNLSLAVFNTIEAIRAGASMVDATLCGLGAGSGNTQHEVLVGVLQKYGIDSGVNFYKVMDAAQDILKPMMQRPQIIDNASLMLGYSGVYSSFLLHVYRAAELYGVDARDIMVELGKRKVVGGQEDMIVAVAVELAG